MSKSSKATNNEQFRHKIRILLNLWDLGALETEINQGAFNQRIKGKSEPKKLYEQLYEELEGEGAITRTPVRNSFRISLTAQGLEILGKGLKNPQFLYTPHQKPKVKDVNAILKWLQGLNQGIATETSKEPQNQAITSYDEFKEVALAVYDRLNRDYNLDHLVPIYRIRREIGGRTSRSQFSDWLLEMQSNDIFVLIGGDDPNVTPDQIEDSIIPPIGNLRYYAKLVGSEY